MKKILFLLSIALLSACSSTHETDFSCPNVSMAPFFNRVERFSENSREFKAEIVGFEGYCRYDERSRKATAYIAPIFEITRYRPGYGSYQYVNEVRLRFFTDTSENKDGLGHATHAAALLVKEINKKTMVTGPSVEVGISYNNPDHKIKLGIVLSNAEYRENLKLGLGAK